MNLSSNFTENTAEKINQVLNFAQGNKYSNFYRLKYGSSPIGPIYDYGDFQKIPFLTKNEFLSVPLKDRTFVAPKEIKYYSFSSGTTGSPKPTAVPHSSFYHQFLGEHLINHKRLGSLGVERLMTLMPPLSPALFRTLTLRPDRVIIIPGDINNLKLMAKIASEISLQAIMTTPAILDIFIKELEQINFNLSAIKWLYIGSEFCSSAKFNYFKNKLPNAYINMRFGSSEIGDGDSHYQCRHLANKEVSVFHIDSSRELIEITDADGRVLPLGEVGEIVHTDLTNKALPLIRYRTNDMGSLYNEPCACGNNFKLNLAGRAGYDIMKFSGVTINAEMAARAVEKLKEFIEPRFQIHVYEENAKSGLKPKLIFHLQLKSGSTNGQNEFFKAMLLEKLSAEFYLSSKSNLRRLVEQNIFFPPEIVFVESWPQPASGKFKNIISHLS